MLPPRNAAFVSQQYFFLTFSNNPKKYQKKNKKNKSRKNKHKLLETSLAGAAAAFCFCYVAAGVASGRSSSSSASPFPAPSATRRRLVPFNILARHIAAAATAAAAVHRGRRSDVATFHAAMLPRFTLPSCHIGCVKLIGNGDWAAAQAATSWSGQKGAGQGRAGG